MSAYRTAAQVPAAETSTSEADNQRVWDGARRGHYEVWYVTLNHRESQTGYWIRYTLESPQEGHGDPYAQLWFAHFDAREPARTFAINRRFPIAALSARATPFEVRIGDAVLEHAGARGQLAGAGHEARWELSWLPAPSSYRQLPDVMYRRGGLGDTTVLTPNLDVPIRGTIVVDGRTFTLEGEPGGQTHLWGKKHAYAWAWGHCNAFAGRRGAALESLTVRLKRRGRVLPPLTILGLTLDGEQLHFNQFRNVPFSRGDYGTGRYAFSARGAKVRLEGEFSCRPELMINTPYVDPDGEPSFCANSEVADLRVTVWRRDNLLARWREQTRLLAPRAAHFEVAGRDRDPAISKEHTAIAPTAGES